MRTEYIAMRKHDGKVKVAGQDIGLTLPKGCTGIALIFETKQAAWLYWGRDLELIEVIPREGGIMTENEGG